MLAALDRPRAHVTTAAGRRTQDAEASTAVRLARTAAPAFAAGLHWSAWERALRSGAEAARLDRRGRRTGLLPPRVGRPRALRRPARPGPRRAGGLHRPARRPRRQARHHRGPPRPRPGRRPLRHAVRRRRAHRGGRGGARRAARGVVVAAARCSGRLPDGRGHRPATPRRCSSTRPTRASPRTSARGSPGRLVSGTRRNLVAAGAGALLVAVLGTVVTLGATSNRDSDTPSERVGVNPSASQGDDDSLGADKATKAADAKRTDDAPRRAHRPGTRRQLRHHRRPDAERHGHAGALRRAERHAHLGQAVAFAVQDAVQVPDGQALLVLTEAVGHLVPDADGPTPSPTASASARGLDRARPPPTRRAAGVREHARPGRRQSGGPATAPTAPVI